MTQHIEPAAWMWTDSTGCVHMAGDRPDIYTAAATVAQLPEPLYDAAALAAAEERGRPQWQPIETAPKDGTPVLLGYLDKRGWFAAKSALWFLVHPKNKEKDWAYAWVCPSMQTLIDNRATHWMPLLAPHAITKEPIP